MKFIIEGTKLKEYKWDGEEKDIIIPEEITEIGRNAFAYYSKIKSIVLPKNLKKADNAFYNCNAELILQPDVVAVPMGIYSGTESVNLPETIKIIEKEAFYNCKNLTNINLCSIEEIGENAFENCTSLKSITLQPTLKKISAGAFKGCEKLKSITFRNKEYNVTVCADFLKSDGTLKADTEAMFKFVIDKNDENFAAIKKADYKIPMALLWYFNDENETAKAYIKKNIKKVIVYLAKNNNVAMIYKILPLGFITKKNVDAIVDAVIEATDNAEIRAVFLTYRHNNFGERDIFKELEEL